MHKVLTDTATLKLWILCCNVEQSYISWAERCTCSCSHREELGLTLRQPQGSSVCAAGRDVACAARTSDWRLLSCITPRPSWQKFGLCQLLVSQQLLLLSEIFLIRLSAGSVRYRSLCTAHSEWHLHVMLLLCCCLLLPCVLDSELNCLTMPGRALVFAPVSKLVPRRS